MGQKQRSDAGSSTIQIIPPKQTHLCTIKTSREWIGCDDNGIMKSVLSSDKFYFPMHVVNGRGIQIVNTC